MTIRYLAEGFYPSTLRVGSGVLKVGASSYEIGSGLFEADGRCIGLAESVLVYTRERRSHPMPEALRAVLARYLVARD